MEDIVTFELAKKLKEKGFPQSPDYFNYSSYYDWDGLRKIHSLSNASVWFDPNISKDNIYFAPTISQVLKWLREEKKIYVSITYSPKIENFQDFYYATIQYIGDYQKTSYTNGNDNYDNWEEAALNGIEYVLYNLI